MKFRAEITEIKTRRAASLDKIITLKLETNNEAAIDLQKYIAQDTVEVRIDE